MFITTSEIRELSSFSEVKALTDVQLNYYINRADNWIMRETHRRDLPNTTDERIQSDLKTATLLLVEYIWYLDQEEVKESNMAGLDSEKIGTYSYNKGQSGGARVNEELNQIFDSLRVSGGVNLFTISKPSQNKEIRYSPHAWVSDYED